MANRKFISFLGTTNYVQVYYGSTDGNPTRFVQESLIDSLCHDWDEDDHILIFCTEGPNGSFVKNWQDNGHPDFLIKEDIERFGLCGILEKKKLNGLKPDIQCYYVPEGFSEEEVWQIFDRVYSKLNENDQIYFDVTHAFRSIPLFSTILFNFSKYALNTNLCGVYYGAFEKLGIASDVRKLPMSERIAPIIDLTSIITLQDLTNTASDLKKYGRVGSIWQMVEKAANGLDESKSSSKLKASLMTIKKCANDLEQYIMANRMTDIEEGRFAKEFNNVIDKAIASNKLNSAELNIFKKLKALFSKFSPEKSRKNIETAIEWAQEYGMIQQAYTLGQEYIITICSDRLNDYASSFNDNKEFREFISGILGMKKGTTEDKYHGEVAKHIDTARSILQIDWILQLKEHYSKLAKNRNTINHGKGNEKFADLVSQFNSYYTECMKVLGLR